MNDKQVAEVVAVSAMSSFAAALRIAPGELRDFELEMRLGLEVMYTAFTAAGLDAEFIRQAGKASLR